MRLVELAADVLGGGSGSAHRGAADPPRAFKDSTCLQQIPLNVQPFSIPPSKVWRRAISQCSAVVEVSHSLLLAHRVVGGKPFGAPSGPTLRDYLLSGLRLCSTKRQVPSQSSSRFTSSAPSRSIRPSPAAATRCSPRPLRPSTSRGLMFSGGKRCRHAANRSISITRSAVHRLPPSRFSMRQVRDHSCLRACSNECMLANCVLM